jgi:glyoxylase-like metal-dependent hydrolase (beta-lactamase superfamily II)
MILSTVLPGLHEIPLPTPFPIGDVNTYLAEGDPLTLIDCGPNTPEAYDVLTAGLAEIGYKISDIQRLLITHHHVDHVGLAQRIVEESGAEVWSHSSAVRWLETPEESRSEFQAFAGGLFRESGVPSALIARMELVEAYLWSLSSKVCVQQRLSEGDTVELAGQRWRVYHTPGHAGDMICLYDAETQVLLASDHILNKVSSNPLIEPPDQPGEPRPKRLLDYMREMQRIAALDIQIAYPGHGEPATNVPELVASRLAFHQKRADTLYALFENQPRTLYELTEKMFPAIHDSQKILTLSEVLGHLDLLERDGRIGSERRDGLIFWLPG